MFVDNYQVSSMLDYLKTKYADTYSLNNGYFDCFTNIHEEYSALKNGIGIHINFNSVIVEMTGKDVLDFLHRVSTNSIKDVAPFYKRNTLFLNEKGRFIDRTICLNLSDRFLLIGSKDGDNKLYNWINKYIIMEDIKTANVSSKYAVFDFAGSQAESYLTLILGNELKSLNGENILNPSVDGFNFFVFSHHEKSGVKYYKIVIEKEHSSKFVEYLFENKSVFDLSLCGEEAFNIFRVEMGIPVSPNEINDEFNPHEIDLLDEINFTKGCYIGQEVIARLETYDKVQKKNVGVVISSDEEISLPSEIFEQHSHEEIGMLTSTARSYLLNQTIGLAVIRKKVLSEPNKLFLKTGSKEIPVAIKELPFKK